MAVTDNTRPPAALPPGTRLHEFELRRVLGIGGFGIVYLAFDHALEREVAIKEYMPASLVGRSSNGPMLSLLSETHADSFALGLRSFVNEARLLARFDAPGLVKVHRYWEANNTAYMAMPFYAGSTLHAVRRRMDGPPDEAWLRGILQPLLVALERLHREGIYHRDISPDNVILQPDGQPVLLDLGAARQVLTDKSVALTAILKPAYAPIEQYAEVGAVKQGAWTDLYALGATVHFLVLGKAPPPATARAVEDEMPPLAHEAALRDRCTPGFLQAVDWMLKPRPADRPQSVAALRIALARRGDEGEERTILDLSHLPPTPGAPGTPRTPRASAQPADEATVLLPRSDAPTVLLPPRRAPPAPLRDEPTILMPRREDRTKAPADAPNNAPTIAPTIASPSAEVSLLLPLDDAPHGSRPAFDAVHEPTMRVPPPGASTAPSRHAHRDTTLPRPAAGPRPAVVASVVLGLVGAGLAAWLLLKPAAAPATADAQPAPATTAPAPATPPAPTPAAAGAAAITDPAGTTAAAPAPAAVRPGAVPPGVLRVAPAARAEPTRQGDARPARLGTSTPTSATAPAAPTTHGGVPGLATSITRLPPAAEPVVVAVPRAAAEQARAAPVASPASTTTAPLAATPAVAGGLRGAETQVPRPAAREADAVSLQSRALSPAERCASRSGAAQTACIERICRAEATLREHADCIKARRDSATH